MNKIPFKICGLTREEDVACAAKLGASYLGVIMVPGTPRCVSREQARRLFAVSSLPKVLVVGDLQLAEVQWLIDDLRPDYVQLHRDEPPEFALALRGVRIWRAFSLRTPADVDAAAIYPAEAIVADTGKGGSGSWMPACATQRKQNECKPGQSGHHAPLRQESQVRIDQRSHLDAGRKQKRGDEPPGVPCPHA